MLDTSGNVVHESDVPVLNYVTFVTGFDDLVIEKMTTVMFNAPVPTYDGYYFEGWFLDAEFTQPYTPDYTFTGDTVLYAKWSQYKTVTIVTGFDDYVVEPIQAVAGQPFHLPGFSYPDYEFKGAFTSEDFSPNSQFQSGTILEEDITLYLSFQKFDSTALLRRMVERLEGLVYVQMASIIMLIAGVIASVFFIRRHG